jgi:polyhydroxyalkanoate synthesis regulator phasin
LDTTQHLFKCQDKKQKHGKIPGWVEKIFTPEVNELIGEVKALNTKVDSLRNETKRNEMISRFEAADARFDSLEARIPVMEKIAELEVRLAEIEKKLSMHA